MKKYNYIIVSLLACLLTTSCNDYFDRCLMTVYHSRRFSQPEMEPCGIFRTYTHSYRMNLTNVRCTKQVCTVLPVLDRLQRRSRVDK